MSELSRSPFKNLKSFSSTDILSRGTSSNTKASATTSTTLSSNLFERQPIKKFLLNSKLKKTKLDPIIDTDEFRFLCRVFIPKRSQLHNENNQTLKQLQNILPVLLPHSDDTTNISYAKLNFQLHLFLATIMCKYVCSWYLKKLNTDNMEFIQQVYQVLCKFVQEFARRSSILVNQDNLMKRIDQLSKLLNDHIQELQGDDTLPKVIKHSLADKTNVVTSTNQNNQDILDNYLRQKHVIFSSQENFNNYFRVLTKKILEATFDNDDTLLTNSTIGMNFVTIICGDLVLNKVFEKLSSPEFLLSIINKIIQKVKAKLDSRIRVQNQDQNQDQSQDQNQDQNQDQDQESRPKSRPKSNQ